MLKKSLLIFCGIILNLVFVTNAANSSQQQDSYINALQDSHKIVSREDFDFMYTQDQQSAGLGGYEYNPPSNKYPPQSMYGESSYNSQQHLPQPQSQLPSQFQPQPPQSHGPPIFHSKPAYGPPPPHLIYGPPHPPPTVIYHPRETWFWDKFKFKIDLFTIGKILLKLIIFKKIVKFIALICLLLFLPKLKNLIKEDDDDMDTNSGDSRKLFSEKEKLKERINEINKFAMTAINSYAKKNKKERSNCDVWCKLKRTVNEIDQKYSYAKILKLYLPDSQQSMSETQK